jgi:hypothetical protein
MPMSDSATRPIPKPTVNRVLRSSPLSRYLVPLLANEALRQVSGRHADQGSRSEFVVVVTKAILPCGIGGWASQFWFVIEKSVVTINANNSGRFGLLRSTCDLKSRDYNDVTHMNQMRCGAV